MTVDTARATFDQAPPATARAGGSLGALPAAAEAVRAQADLDAEDSQGTSTTRLAAISRACSAFRAPVSARPRAATCKRGRGRASADRWIPGARWWMAALRRRGGRSWRHGRSGAVAAARPWARGGTSREVGDGMAIIEVDGLVKRYGKVVALDGVSFRVDGLPPT